MKDLILGIDPGFTGALALFNPSQKRVVDVYDMPLQVKAGILDTPKDVRQEIDGERLNEIIKPLSSRIALAVVERVHASPGAGVTSMFRFGEGYGLLLGLLIANGVKTITPAPSVWKCAMGLTHDKKLSFVGVEQYIDEMARLKFCPLAKHHGRAEAILLAVYGAKKHKPVGLGLI